jgi:hypothetical protein
VITVVHQTDQGSRLARAWLAVAGAASTDKERPALYRVVLLEVYETGVRLSATDSYWSATAWVGNPIDLTEPLTSDHHPEPRGEPLTSVGIIDHDKRIGGLMAYVRQQTSKLDEMHPDVSVTVSVTDEHDDSPNTLPDIGRDLVRVEIPGAEHVTGYDSEIEYPHLGKLIHAQEVAAGAIADLSLAPRILKAIGSACERGGGLSCSLKFTGSRKAAIRWQAIDIEVCDLYGLAMPIRPREDDDT